MSVVRGRYDIGLTVRVSQDCIDKIRVMCKERKISQGELIRRMVEQEFGGFSELQERSKSAFIEAQDRQRGDAQ